MPKASVNNPNGPSKNRLAARAAKAKKISQKQSFAGKHKIAPRDMMRGARPGLLPTSGPRAQVSSKKARKLEKKLGYALQRKMEAEAEGEGEEMMEDAAEAEEGENEKKNGPVEVEMEGIQ